MRFSPREAVMDRGWWRLWSVGPAADERDVDPPARLVADGGRDDPSDDRSTDRAGDSDGGSGSGDDGESEPNCNGEGGPDDDDAGRDGNEKRNASDGDGGEQSDTVEAGDQNGSNVEATPAGQAEPADPKWEKLDPDDIPEFEIRADPSRTRPAGGDRSTDRGSGTAGSDPTAGRPNAARAPGAGESRISGEGTEGYVAALELCARLPDDVRLPDEAADLVPAAVEAELERDVQAFAAEEFDNPSPHVEVLDFLERDGEVWLRLRLGIPAAAFADLDPEEIRSHALQELEGLL